MKANADTAANDDDAPWADARPWLDDALAALPAGEREAVLLHFYARLPYRVVGEKLGQGEDAARKRVGRALERMAAFLQRRGATLSVAALASGLGTRLAEASMGASGAVPLASAALKAAPRLSSLSVFTTSLALMTRSSTLLPAASVTALLLLLGGGGFLAGHHRAQAAARKRASASAPPAAVSTHVGGKAAAAALAASVDDLRRLVQSVVALQREASTQPGRYREVEALLKSVPADQFPEFLRLLDAECAWEKDVHSTLEQYAIQHWARHPGHGLAATEEAARRSPDPGREGYLWGALMNWAKHDAASSHSWLTTRPGLGSDVRQRLGGSIFEGWAETDPAAAIRAAAELPFDDQRVAVAWLPRGFWEEKTRDAYIEAAAAAPDPRFRADLMRRTLISADSERFIDAHATLFDLMNITDPVDRWRLARDVAEYMYKRSPAEAARWLHERAPEANRSEVLEDFVTIGWADHDRAGAEAWLREKGYDPAQILRPPKAKKPATP